jgi:hypothetical protein
MEIKYICTYWGSDQLTPDEFVSKAMDAGYDGVEMNIPFDASFTSKLIKAVNVHGAVLIAQQWLPPASETVDSYRSRMKDYLEHLVAHDPLFINSHTGKDYFSFQENCSILEDTQEIASRSGIPILHETHRGRFAFHTHSLLPYLDKFPQLALNADFSHFCNVSESLLEDQEAALGRIMDRSSYIHARVGSDQSAQVNHPFAPEWRSTLQRFTSWWQEIIDRAKAGGEEVFYICPEFGPSPYIQSEPFTQKPVVDQWEINLQMKHFLKETLS